MDYEIVTKSEEKVKLAEPQTTFSKDAMKEIGGDGIIHSAGQIITDEYVAALTGKPALLTYDKMIIGDGTIAMCLAGKELAIKSGTRTIEPGEDTPQGKKIAEAVEKWLFRDMETQWDSIIHHGILAAAHGRMGFEPVYEKNKEGDWFVHRYEPRLAKTIDFWLNFPDTNIFRGIKGQAIVDGKLRQFELLVEEKKVVMLTWAMRGTNWEGQSIVRPGYKAWKMKSRLGEQLWAIRVDRFLAGTPIGKLPEGANLDSAEVKNFKEQLRNYKGGEQSYFLLPFGADLIFPDITDTGNEMLEFLRYWQQEIVNVLFSKHYLLGDANVGSWALAQTQAGAHGVQSQAIAKWICDALFNKTIIKWLVDANFGPQEFYPELIIGGINAVDIKMMSDALAAVSNAGLLQNSDPAVLQYVRDLFEISALDDRLKEAADKKLDNMLTRAEQEPIMIQAPPVPPVGEKPPEVPIVPEKQPEVVADEKELNDNRVAMVRLSKLGSDKCSCGQIKSLAERNFRSRDNVSDTVKDVERRIMKADEVVRGLDSREAQAIQLAKAFEAKITRPIAEAAAQGENLNTFSPPGKKKFQDDLIKSMFGASGFGIGRLESELKMQGITEDMLSKAAPEVMGLVENIFGVKTLQEIPPGIDDETAALIIEIGEKQTELLVNRFKATASTAATNVTRQEAVRRAGARTAQDLLEASIPDEEKINDIIRELANLSDKPTEAAMRAAISESHGLGRNAGAQANQGVIILEVYTAVLDGNLCDVCGPNDGQTHVQGDPMFMAPNPNCFGTLGSAAGNPCRCLNIPVSNRGLAEQLAKENPALKERLEVTQ